MQNLKISTQQSTQDERRRTIPHKKELSCIGLLEKTTSNNNTHSYFKTKNIRCNIKTNHFETNNVRSHLNTNLSNQWAF
jgi:hypothetical protein